MKTPKTYRLSQETLDYLQDLKELDCNKGRTETDLIENALRELWACQRLLGVTRPTQEIVNLTKAGD